jgi:poly(glycerol-phosphate) alpha-glucosyltransferase
MSRIIQITSWLSNAGGGIPPVIRALAAEYRVLQPDCVIGGIADPTGAPPEFPVDWHVLAGHIAGPAAFGYSPELARQLQQCVQNNSVIHVHGLWMYPGLLARRLADAAGTVRIVSPHGMLEPWALENSRWKKRLAALAFENRNLRSADCLHALCEAEARNMRNYGLRNPIAVIPNGVALEDFSPLPSYEAIEAEHPLLKGKKRMLFLSRIHPKKGLPHLLRAWQRLATEFNDWVILIGGIDQLGHEQVMRSLTIELGLGSSVIFLGPRYDDAKKRAMAGSDAFVLPSFSEGFSMVVLEAAAGGLPVLLTPQCNFPELAAAGGAIEMQPDVASCEKGLRQMLSLSDAQRKNMGSCGRELIKKTYTWPAIATQMTAVYAWLLQQGSKPDCVCLN